MPRRHPRCFLIGLLELIDHNRIRVVDGTIMRIRPEGVKKIIEIGWGNERFAVIRDQAFRDIKIIRIQVVLQRGSLQAANRTIQAFLHLASMPKEGAKILTEPPLGSLDGHQAFTLGKGRKPLGYRIAYG